MGAPLKEFGGRRFSFGKMTATKAVRVQVALLRVLGEPIFKLIVLGTGGKKKKPVLAPAPPANDVPADGPPAAPEAAEGGGSVMGFDLDADDIQVIGATIGLLTTKMDADELINTMELVLESVRCEGVPISSVDAMFGDGRNLELWRVFIEALKVNFADFFPASLSALFAKAAATQK